MATTTTLSNNTAIDNTGREGITIQFNEACSGIIQASNNGTNGWVQKSFQRVSDPSLGNEYLGQASFANGEVIRILNEGMTHFRINNLDNGGDDTVSVTYNPFDTGDTAPQSVYAPDGTVVKEVFAEQYDDTSYQAGIRYPSNNANQSDFYETGALVEFLGRMNYIRHWSFNSDAEGAQIDPNFHSWGFGLENDYEESSGVRKAEWYVRGTRPGNTNEIRPIMITWQLSGADQWQVLHAARGDFWSVTNPANTFTALTVDTAAGTTLFYGTTGTDLNVRLRPGTGRTANLWLERPGITNFSNLKAASDTTLTWDINGATKFYLIGTANGNAAGGAIAIGTNSNAACLVAKSNVANHECIRTSLQGDSGTGWHVAHRNAANDTTISGVDGRGIAVLRSYTVANLPGSGNTVGNIAFATNGRKNGEGAASGTGVVVFWDGTAWRAVDTGATVAA